MIGMGVGESKQTTLKENLALLLNSIALSPWVLVFFLVTKGRLKLDNLQVFLELLYPHNCTKAEDTYHLDSQFLSLSEVQVHL